MLSGSGFENVINLSGGFKGWKGDAAYGGKDLGLQHFSMDTTPQQALAVAYSLEDGLRDFYIKMAEKVTSDDAKALFLKLSTIEVKHQDRIYKEYENLASSPLSREAFENQIVAGEIEGGLTTEEYLNLFKPDLESTQDIISIAMSIEAQALDLYQRAFENVSDETSKKALLNLAEEERTHIAQLGKLMDRL